MIHSRMAGPVVGLAVAVVVTLAAFWLMGSGEANTPAGDAAMETARSAAPAGSVADAREMVVHLTPACGCCVDWVEHMEEHGFEVEVRQTEDLRSIKIEKGVPPALGSCHTAEVGGYVIEGHIPAEDVIGFLEEAPDAVGLAVPGMPIGSPGMEGAFEEEYEVLTFDHRGRTQVFATHP